MMNGSTQLATTKRGQSRALSTQSLSKQIQQTKAKTGRLMVSFWLDVSKQSEHELNEHIRMLKKKRMFSYSIRAGLALLKDLREGHVDVLCDMFPWIRERLQPQDQFGMLVAQISQLQQQLQQGHITPILNPSIMPMMLPEPSLMEADTQTVTTVNTGADSRKQFDASILRMFDEDD